MPLQLPSADPHPLARGLHRTDAFHRHPLLAVEAAPGSHGLPLVVRSWNEAHALHGPARLTDVNPAYVAGLISGSFTAEAAPYLRIRRLPRAHHVLIAEGGGLHASPYDPISGGAAAMAPDTLHLFLREGLLDHLRRELAAHSGPIGCEHSSGLDSNAVLGALVHGVGLPPSRLHTWSFEMYGEGPELAQFRPFFHLQPDHCHRRSPGDAPAEEGDDILHKQLAVFGAPAQIGGSPDLLVALGRQGCTLVFSGFGGDQALSHNANNVPTDLVAQGRWQELIQWMGGRRSAAKTAGGRVLALSHRPWAVGRVRRQSRGFYRSDLLERALTPAGKAWLSPHFQESYPWEIDGYVSQHDSIRRRVLADWVAVRVEEEIRMAAAHGMAKAFPLLDERLIATLLQQDPVLFGEGVKRGRLLHRRAFAPFLPPFLRENPTKEREPEGGPDAWRAEMVRIRSGQIERRLQASASWHPALAKWWHLDAIRREAEALLQRSDSHQIPSNELMKEVLGIADATATLAALNGWWHALDG